MHEEFENEIKDWLRTDQETTKLTEQEERILEFWEIYQAKNRT